METLACPPPQSQARLIEANAMGLIKSPTNAAAGARGLGLAGEDMGGTPPALQSLLGEMASDSGGGSGRQFSDYQQQQQQQQVFGGNQHVVGRYQSWCRCDVMLGGWGFQLLGSRTRSYVRAVMLAAAFHFRPTAEGCSAMLVMTGGYLCVPLSVPPGRS